MTAYDTFTTRIVQEATINLPSDTAFTAHWPAMLLDAEIRIYRELDPLNGRRYQKTTFPSALVNRSRLLVPPGCIIMRSLYYWTPAGSETKLNPIERRDEDYVNEYWPDRSVPGLPKYFCELAHDQILVVPTADNVYRVQMGFTKRANSLSVDTGGTYLLTTYPDLLFFAAMIEVAGFKKNYGAMADDPQAAMSWEGHYQAAKGAALIEEARRKSGSYADESPSQPPERNAIQ